MGAETHKGNSICICGRYFLVLLCSFFEIIFCVFQIIGYVCAVEAFILSGLARWPQLYRHVLDDGSEMYIEDREMILLSTAESTEVPNHNSTPHSEANHHNQCNRISSSSSCNQKPYIPGEFISEFFKNIHSLSIYPFNNDQRRMRTI